MTGRTKFELGRESQEKATAHRQGTGAFKAGDPRSSNPYLNQPGHEHQAQAWDRAWQAEQTLFGGNDRERKP